jgi:hypothetical protein
MTAKSWNGLASLTEELATMVGDHRVTFAAGRDSLMQIDGTPVTGMATGDVRNLDGGTLTQMYDTVFRLDWKSGNSLTVYDVNGDYLDWNVGLGAQSGPGSVHGLLGSNTGQANDFQLRDGTLLAQPSDDVIATTYADSWRVAPGASLLDAPPALAQLVQAMSANLVPAGSGSDGQGTQQDANAQNPLAPSLLHT